MDVLVVAVGVLVVLIAVVVVLVNLVLVAVSVVLIVVFVAESLVEGGVGDVLGAGVEEGAVSGGVGAGEDVLGDGVDAGDGAGVDSESVALAVVSLTWLAISFIASTSLALRPPVLCTWSLGCLGSSISSS